MKTKFFKTAKCWATARVAPTLFIIHCSLFIILWPAALMAQNGVTVGGLAVDAGTVTFNVSWDKNAQNMPALWSDSVWVWVDYNDMGTMMRLPLLSGATLTAHTALADEGKVIEVSGNNKGVWVVGNARSAGSFSATVTLLTAAADIAGACVYGSNYPPVGDYTSASDISFTGTLPYDVVLKDNGDATTTVLVNSGTYTLSAGYTVQSFTDKTGAPGIFKCIPPAAPTVAPGEFCYEQSGTLMAAAAENVIVTWYDAATGGILLHTGEVLPVPPLYNTSTQYYAQAMYADDCRSSRTWAAYTVANCTMSGNCPGYTAGNIDAPTAPAACVAHYTGQIGAAALSPSCMAHDAGRIGKVKN
jgi:hypothetical protein